MSLPEVVKFVGEKRQECLVLRDAIRVYINRNVYEKKKHMSGLVNLQPVVTILLILFGTTFRSSLRELLEGTLEEREYRLMVEETGEKKFKKMVPGYTDYVPRVKLDNHTLLEILYRLGMYPDNFSADDLKMAILRQRHQVQMAMKSLNRAYQNIKEHVYRKS